ncbi:hypothetical protein OU760_001118 [Yersinia enterocolitica]|nr:hypothetical protein [Yersinia enterocolitica]
MSNLFLSHPFLGDLCISNIYEEYDGPRLFSVENEVGSAFIAYWIGNNDDFDNWFLIPCSKSKIIAYEKKNIDLLTLLSQQEQANFYKIEIPFCESKQLNITPMPSREINSIKLPRSGLYVEDITTVSLAKINEALIPTHELKVSKSNKDAKKNVLLEHVTRVCEKFSELVNSFNATNGIQGSIQPLNARYGSFVLSLHAEEMMKFEKTLERISELMLNQRDITPYLRDNDIDIKSFCSLLEAIVSTSVNFELKSKFSDDSIIIIYKKDAVSYLKSISGLALQYVSSYQVPQANDLTKVFKIVDMTWNGDDINPITLGVDKRHVAYYKHAAKSMGFLESNGSITSTGQKIASSLEDIGLRYRIAARSFESSNCGWAWVNWSGVNKLSDIDPESAENFLLESCPSLSEETAKRRATTLSKWCRELKPYYVEL